MVPPGSLRSIRRVAVVVAAVATAVTAAVVVSAAPPPQSAVVGVHAERLPPPVGDLVVIFDVGEVDAFVVQAAARAATEAGGTSTVSRTGSLGMREIRRGSTVIHAPPPGYLIPIVFVAVPHRAIGRVMGDDVAVTLGPGKVVMNEITAGITGAAVGDVIVMQSASGAPVPLQITGIASPDQIGSAELVFTYDVADALGATKDTRVVLHDFDRSKIDAALVAEGITGRKDTRAYRSWDPPNPDDVLSTVEVKESLGEPWYRFNSDGSISMHPDWIATNLTPSRELLNDTIRIRARCHVRVVDDLRAALAEVAAAGLWWAIDVANANTYGGCYGGARFSRMSGQIGFLSRHSYGMALDTNTTSNCEGCTPRMNCDVVRIFRKHGFAWGGNFRVPDGMHFEWVGERRDTWVYPLQYCPNDTGPPPSAASSSASLAPGGATVLTIGGEAGM